MSRNGQPYQRLETQGTTQSDASVIPPLQPPLYDEGEDELTLNLPSQGIEQFEIEDMFEENTVREGWVVRASLVTQKLANRFNHRFIHPISTMIDPVYEGYKYFSLQYEQVILKLGNPLVVKRLFYLLFVMVLLFFVSKYDVTDAVDGTSGGGFSLGKFYSIDKLSDSLRSYIDPNQMKTNLEYLSSMPHLAGTMGDLTSARYVQRHMNNNGLKSVEFNELGSFLSFPSSKNTYVRLADGSFEAELYEFNENDMHHLSFNPNSLNTKGEIEEKFLYANHGSVEDFKRLEEAGIDLKDCILLIKYGGSIPEANKVKLAEKFQVKAILFISPAVEIVDQDGKTNLHEDIIQKENVGLTRDSPGDVLSPGWSDVTGYTSRLPWEVSTSTPKIPTIPISRKDATKLLSKLNQGIKNDDGFVSGKSEGIKIKMRIENQNRPGHNMWNVVGSIEGREQSNKGIIIGASRDATCFGTMSSNSATVVLLEIIRVFTSLQRLYNWSPSRSIYFVSFDGTENNLAGLTEWLEGRKESLLKEGYAYIDLSDMVTGDDLSVKAHPFLHTVVKNALKKVKSDRKRNEDGKLDFYQLFMKSNKGSEDISYNLLEQKNYLLFINFINMPTLEIKFTGKKYPKHSCYDNFENWSNSNIDPSMTKHEQLVELLSIIALNLAEDPVIPYNFHDMANHLSNDVKDLQRYAHDIINSMRQRNTPRINFDPLVKGISMLRDSGNRFHEWQQWWRQYLVDSAAIEPSITALDRWRWNDHMLAFNMIFLTGDAKRRPGYMNTLFGAPYDAPEHGTGYEWNTFPAIREALNEHDWAKAEQEIQKLANLIGLSAERLILF